MERILVVCAHPDDETLGAGGTIAMHKKRNERVFVLILATGQFGRDDTPGGIRLRQKQCQNACSILDVDDVQFFGYDDQRLDSISLVELVEKIESVVKKINPTIVYTHYWGDVNQDHRRVYEATLIATRPTPQSKIKQLLCFEIPSSTELGFGENRFNPNLFQNIKKTLNLKLRAFQQYKNEVQPYPHPRSKDAIVTRARYWGAMIGVEYVEAFISVREIKND
ncbi:MAG: PIG-L deacetylase family protein [Candidatus Nitrosotenuis sp.]